MSDTDPLYPPWGTVTADFWARPSLIQTVVPAARTQEPAPSSRPDPMMAVDAAPEMPDAYRDGIIFVTSAFTSNDEEILQAAVVEAERLDQAMSSDYGEHDLRTISVREMRGWLAHLTGQHETAVHWYLHTVGLLAPLVGTADDRTRASAKRAVATWLAIADEVAARGLASAVLAMAETVEGKESAIAQVVRRHSHGATPVRP